MELLDVANRALVRLGAKKIGSLTEESDSAVACNEESDPCRLETLRAFPWNFARKRIRLNTFPQATLVPSAEALVQDAVANFFSADSPFLASRDEGYVLAVHGTNDGRARIVSVTDAQNVLATVEAPFLAVTPLVPNTWRFKPGWEYEFSYPKPSDYVRLVKVERVGGIGSVASVLWSYWRDLGSEPEPIKIEGDRLVSDAGAKLDIAYTRNITDLDKWDALSISALVAKLAFRICYAVTGSLQASRTQHDAFVEILAEARTMDSQEGSIDQSGSDILLTVRV
jgi:hypothetical protein